MKYIFLILFFIPTSIFGQENFVLIGPPGGGKGTFSTYMTRKYNYHHICPGDILRAHIKNNTELGQEIKPIVERGDDVDTAIVFNIIDQAITYCLNEKIPFIIDGFPRNVPTFEFLLNLFKNKDICSNITFVHFKIDNQTCLERINNRLVCLKCGAIFNKLTNMPKNSTICDYCNNDLQIRIGDIQKNTIKRLDNYRKDIEPLTKLAKKHFKLFSIDTNVPLENCLKIYEDLIK